MEHDRAYLSFSRRSKKRLELEDDQDFALPSGVLLSIEDVEAGRVTNATARWLEHPTL